jgi:hypothetical protein
VQTFDELQDVNTNMPLRELLKQANGSVAKWFFDKLRQDMAAKGVDAEVTIMPFHAQ